MCNYIDKEAHKDDGFTKSYSTPEGIYCALLTPYVKNKHPLPGDFRSEWSQYTKGFKNQNVNDRQAAAIVPTAGSDKFAIEYYRKFVRLQLILSNSMSGAFSSFHGIV